jgi:hypothetical protein
LNGSSKVDCSAKTAICKFNLYLAHTDLPSAKNFLTFSFLHARVQNVRFVQIVHRYPKPNVFISSVRLPREMRLPLSHRGLIFSLRFAAWYLRMLIAASGRNAIYFSGSAARYTICHILYTNLHRGFGRNAPADELASPTPGEGNLEFGTSNIEWRTPS